MAPDGGGGAIAAWIDAAAVHAQRVTASGSVAAGWDPNGLLVGAGSAYAFPPAIASDGSGGAVVAWSDSTGALYVQRLTDSGAVAPGWSPGPLLVSTSADAILGSGLRPALAPDGEGGAYLAWADARSPLGADIYAQHLTATGTIASGWLAGGSPID